MDNLSDKTNNIDDFVNFLVSNFINEDKYEIKKEESEKEILYNFYIDKKYMGKILGKDGKLANSIRELAKSLPNEKKRIFIKFTARKKK